MPISLNSTLRDERSGVIVAEAGAMAKLSVYTAGFTTLLYTSTCGLTLGSVANGVLTFSPIGNATAVAAGSAALARLFKTDGTTMLIDGLTVAVSGGNINISSTTIAINDVVTTSSGTITEGNA